MFKRILLSLFICLSLCSWCTAQEITTETEEVAETKALNLGDIVEQLPELKQGLAYSIENKEFNYISTVEFMQWKDLTFECGYSPSDAILAVISYRIAGLKELGVTMPILDLIEFNLGYYAGVRQLNFENQDDTEFDHGLSVTLMNIKF